MNIAVVGTGYVGLVTGTCFAETGNKVICVDNNPRKLALLQEGQIPIYEPGLEKLFTRNIKEGRLSFTHDLKKAAENADIIFLALPTPPSEDGSADLKYILAVAHELGPILASDCYRLVIDKSTVPVGTAIKVRKAIEANGGRSDSFSVVSNPEFLREGVAVDDFMKPDRVVVGIDDGDERAEKLISRLYSPFVRQGNPVIFMDANSAELTKYAANAFLAIKISFMNEIARLCEKVGADVDMVRHGIGSDGRIGKRFLFSGIGYGGSCFPKDVRALEKSSGEVDYDFKILKAVMEVNDLQKKFLVEKITKFYSGNLSGKKFAFWGLSFKPNTDDIREAPALVMIEELMSKGATICAFDPEAMSNAKEILGDKINFAKDQYDALQDADALVIATEWNEFRTPDFEKIGNLLNEKVIFDGRNLFDLEHVQRLGFHYESIGRKIIDGEKVKSKR